MGLGGFCLYGLFILLNEFWLLFWFILGFEFWYNFELLLLYGFWLILLFIPGGAFPTPNGGATPPSIYGAGWGGFCPRLAKYFFNFLSITLIYCLNRNFTINNLSLGSEYALRSSPNLESNSLNCCLKGWQVL